jgi:hypothetical protein
MLTRIGYEVDNETKSIIRVRKLLGNETNTKTAGIFVPFDGRIALLTIFQNLVILAMKLKFR